MELRIENAYYQEGAPKRGLTGYLGTEIAYYQVRKGQGLQLLSVKPMDGRPRDQPPVQQLLRPSETHYNDYRFFFAVLFKKNSNTRGSVLLGADSAEEMDRLGTQLQADPDSVCDGLSPHCTVFPEACSASLEIEIVVNGKPQTVAWTSRLSSITTTPKQVGLLRMYNGRLTPVRLDPNDAEALRLPLLPGDRITWN